MQASSTAHFPSFCTPYAIYRNQTTKRSTHSGCLLVRVYASNIISIRFNRTSCYMRSTTQQLKPSQHMFSPSPLSAHTVGVSVSVFRIPSEKRKIYKTSSQFSTQHKTKRTNNKTSAARKIFMVPCIICSLPNIQSVQFKSSNRSHPPLERTKYAKLHRKRVKILTFFN